MDGEFNLLVTLETTEAGDVVQTEPVFMRPLGPDGLEQIHGLDDVATIHVRLCKVVVQLADGLPNRDARVFIRLVDVAQLHQLLHGFGALDTVEMSIRWMHAVRVRTLDVIP